MTTIDPLNELKEQMRGAVIWGMPMEEANDQVGITALKMLPVVRALCDNPRIAIAAMAAAYIAVCQVYGTHPEGNKVFSHGMLDEMWESLTPEFFTLAKQFIK